MTGVSEISANSAGSHKYVLLVGTNEENFNPFVSNAPFLYPLETSENRCFQGVENGCIGNKWVKQKKNRLKINVHKNLQVHRVFGKQKFYKMGAMCCSTGCEKLVFPKFCLSTVWIIPSFKSRYQDSVNFHLYHFNLPSLQESQLTKVNSF